MPKTALRLLFTATLAAGALVVVARASLGSSEQTYVVQPGDSLWSISQADGVSVAELAAANDMNQGDLLLAGRTIVIPASAGDADAAPLGSGAAAATGGGSVGTYAAPGTYGVLPAGLVASGDTALMPVFDEWCTAYGVAPALVEAIGWQESGWQQGVVSPDGAVGIGQLLPGTAEFVSQDLLGTPLDVYNLDDNIRMMVRFVAYLAAVEGGNLSDTIAAYYEGPANLASRGWVADTGQYVADVEALMARFE